MASTEIVNVPGVLVTLGGKEYTLPPVSVKVLLQLKPKLETFDESNAFASIDTVLDLVHAALKRNYPDITRDFVADSVDLSNMMPIMEACLDISGLKRKSLDTGE